MNIYKKPMLEFVAYDERDVVTASVPENPYQGGEVGGDWTWKGNGEE